MGAFSTESQKRGQGENDETAGPGRFLEVLCTMHFLGREWVDTNFTNVRERVTSRTRHVCLLLSVCIRSGMLLAAAQGRAANSALKRSG